MGRNNKQKILESFWPEIIIQQWEKLYCAL
jgi:hypothetical protein